MTEKANPFLALFTIFLFIISIVLFTLDQPYWYFGIFTFTIVILIIIIKAMWSIAGWGDKQYQRYFGDQSNVEFSYKTNSENSNNESKENDKK